MEKIKLTPEEMYKLWCDHESNSFVEKRKLSELKPQDIVELFSPSGEEFQFGTSGIRSIVGVGPKRLNLHTYRVFAEAYAKFLNSKYDRAKVLIGYDNRELSKSFARAVYKVLVFNNVRAILSTVSVPTPILAYYIKKRQFHGGIMITASHNPPEYNGMKFYDGRGGQLSMEEEAEIRKLFRKPERYLSIRWNPEIKINAIGNEAFHEYALDLQREIGIRLGGFYPLGSTIIRTIKFLFSSHHGTSSGRMKHLSKMMGSQQFREFGPECTPTFSFPKNEIINPEYPQSFQAMESEARSMEIDYLVAHDPDSDRGALGEFDGTSWYYFTGNEMAILLAVFLLELASNPKYNIEVNYKYLITTYVSGDFIDKVVSSFNREIEIKRTNTGFKSIGQMIEKYSKRGEVLLGCEEAIGLSIFSNLSLEKDGFQQTVLTIFMIGYYKFHSKNLITQLYWLMWELQTIWLGKTIVFNLRNLKHREAILTKLKTLLHSQTLLNIAGFKLKVLPGEIPEIFTFQFENSESWIKARFSGTEPKFKLYFNIYSFFEKSSKQLHKNNWMEFIKGERMKLEKTIASINRELKMILLTSKD
ncbi:phosphohexosemutase [Candidatus Mycoplasma haematominutum]|uniref:Phosphohexosemutase n=1 Tax=Candidatus Mycoplasma haematominutum 'Birmingham 1' TaxID=1116213 RepID=G8C2K0_9MOLU|nr:phosphohexosemutase [Candidatus Mycoplasma haematominutum]CCE66548.1 phosphohexosemutase [Candidatus Mycoplasma haematominutum 'Birmingham 1']